MKVFVSWGFLILLSWISLFSFIFIAEIETGRIFFADTFVNGVISGIIIAMGVVKLPDGAWIGKNNNNKNKKNIKD